MHLPGSRFQRDRGRIERGRCAPDHRDGFAAQRLEIDRVRRVRIKMRRQVAGQHFGNAAAAIACEAGGKDDLPCRLGRDRAALLDMQPQMIPFRFNAQQPGPEARLDAERFAVPVQIGRPVDPRNAIQRVIGPAPWRPSYHDRKDRPGNPSSGPCKPFGVRSLCMRALVSQTPAAAPSLAASITATLPIPARRSAKANALPDWPPPMMTTLWSMPSRSGTQFSGSGPIRRRVSWATLSDCDCGMMIDPVLTSANRKSDPSAVNETKSALFVRQDNDRFVAAGHAGRFATIPASHLLIARFGGGLSHQFPQKHFDRTRTRQRQIRTRLQFTFNSCDFMLVPGATLQIHFIDIIETDAVESGALHLTHLPSNVTMMDIGDATEWRNGQP